MSFAVADLRKTIARNGEEFLIAQIGLHAYDVYMQLQDVAGQEITLPIEVKKQLSAGEKQIFIMALYQALSKLNKIDVPYIVDTPFARIDKEHRGKILDRFFKRLNGQVIILSTDEEIVDRNTIEFLGVWEQLHNPHFNRVQFEAVRNDAGLNRFVMTPTKWIDLTDAVGIVSKAGRYGGTYAHADIAMAFASWISPEFQLYIMKDYRRLKSDENSRLALGWNLNRELSKLNYRIHTDAIKENLIPPELTPQQISNTYASEADMLNVALYGKTARQWRDENPGKTGNIRDYSTIQQLLVLANMESYNAILIEQGLSQAERLVRMRELAVKQLTSLDALSIDLPQLQEHQEQK